MSTYLMLTWFSEYMLNQNRNHVMVFHIDENGGKNYDHVSAKQRDQRKPQEVNLPQLSNFTISGDWKQYWKPFMIYWSVYVYILIMYDMLICYIVSRVNMHVWYDKHGASQNIDV